MPAAPDCKPSDAVDDNEIVLRRIPSVALNVRADGMCEVRKGSFSGSSKRVDPEEGMSVDLLSIVQAQGINSECLETYLPEFEVIMALRVIELHAAGFWVVKRPIKADDTRGIRENTAHCNVLNVRSNQRKSVFRMAYFFRRPADVVKAGDDA